uniref:Uncharacterized protein LOC111115428 isoform X2 n=1 Tax=Crassostrea virginica TaxID=6565 RepID=A0A8B8C325_CRAVI|nr:uncharacterized protein LOC111115428 isoform X2 [Crassostrea virginica]
MEEVMEFVDVYKLYKIDTSEELALPEFYAKHKDNLPMFIIVSGGYYGQTKYDDMSTDQLMRFHCCHSVRRVLAKEPTEANDIKLEYLSIPVNSSYLFQMVKTRTQLSDPMTMSEILEKKEFPILIQFSTEQIIPDEGKNRDGSPASFLIIASHEEHFIQGNYLLNGKISKDTAAVSLCPMISVTPISGYNSEPQEEFDNFIKEMDDFVAKNCAYPESNCDLRIKKYNILDPQIKDVVRSDAVFPSGIYGDTGERLPAPPLPARSKSLKLKNPSNVQNEDDLYEHYVKIKDVHRSKSSESYSKLEELQSGESPTSSSNTAALARFHNSNLSVKDVGDILKKLHLGKYVKKFKSEMIDGEILKEITRTILINDFNFSHVEAIRLEKFIASGHCPE